MFTITTHAHKHANKQPNRRIYYATLASILFSSSIVPTEIKAEEISPHVTTINIMTDTFDQIVTQEPAKTTYETLSYQEQIQLRQLYKELQDILQQSIQRLARLKEENNELVQKLKNQNLSINITIESSETPPKLTQ